MRYQLPDGTSCEISIEEFMSMDDSGFRIAVMSKQHFSSLDEWHEWKKDTDEIEVRRDISQIIRDIPEDI